MEYVCVICSYFRSVNFLNFFSGLPYCLLVDKEAVWSVKKTIVAVIPRVSSLGTLSNLDYLQRNRPVKQK